MFSWIPWYYKFVAVIAIVAGAFFYGYTKGSSKADTIITRYAADKSDLEAELERRNNEISNDVQIEYVDRVNTIREREYVYRDIAQNTVPTQYTMSNGWVYTHDSSAGAGDADPTRASDATPSGITDTTALVGITGNYSRCQQNAEQLILLQNWIRENQAAIDAAAQQAED